tara:strand:+ start:6702 stop:7196 length:495 start_codon:yes stop_codon:yes gene_type:complete
MNYIRNEIYPYTISNLKSDFPNVSFPKNPLSNEGIRNDYSISEVTATAIPVKAGFRAVEGVPQESGGVFSQTWSLEQKDKGSLEPSDIVETSPETRDGYRAQLGEPEFVNDQWQQTWEYFELDWIEKRMTEYGEPGKQIEFITENGLEAWQTKVAEIKAKYPKS